MAMVVKNNMSAVSTLNTLNKNSSALQKSLSKVSSGMKINSAQDDASGYAISERMRVQIRSLDQANQNTQNGSSMMKTAEGAVSSTVEILKSLKEKAINAANDTNKDADRTTIQKEIDQFIDQIDDNALTTFNGKYLVDGSKAQQGKATHTAMTNQSLATDTNGSTKLTALKNRNNESLEIASTDFVTASYVQNGQTYTTKFNVGKDSTLEDVFSTLNQVQKDKDGNSVRVFGPAQTNTQKMSLKDATAIIDAIKAGGDAQANATNLNSIATGKNSVTAALKDANGNAITKDSLAAAIRTLTEKDSAGNAASTTREILTALGSTNGDELGAARTALSNALEDNAAQLSAAVKLKNANPASGADATVSGDSTFTNAIKLDKFYDAEGNEVTDKTVEFTLKPNGGKDFTVNKGNGVTADANFSLAETNEQLKKDWASMVLQSIENVAAKAASDSNYTKTVEDAATDTKDTAGDLAANSWTVTYGAGSKNTDKTAPDGTTAFTKGDDPSKYEDQYKNFALAYAFEAAAGGPLVLGETSAIGLKASQDLQSTANGENGVTVTALNGGVAGQISGVTISITDSDGNVKKAANASLDGFSTTVYAKNESDRNELSFQVGAAANQAIAVGLEDMRSEALGLKGSDGSKVSVATQDKANAAVAVFDNAIQKALDQQTTIGSIEARLAYTSENLTVSSENTQAAESTIRDADMAKEMTNYTKNNVLLQAAQSMLAQANQSSSAVLSLLQ